MSHESSDDVGDGGGLSCSWHPEHESVVFGTHYFLNCCSLVGVEISLASAVTQLIVGWNGIEGRSSSFDNQSSKSLDTEDIFLH